MRSTYDDDGYSNDEEDGGGGGDDDADDGDGNAFDDVYVFCNRRRLPEPTYVRTYVRPTLLGTESWLEAVSRVFLKILGWANLNPGPTNLNHVLHLAGSLDIHTYVRFGISI